MHCQGKKALFLSCFFCFAQAQTAENIGEKRKKRDFLFLRKLYVHNTVGIDNLLWDGWTIIWGDWEIGIFIESPFYNESVF